VGKSFLSKTQYKSEQEFCNSFVNAAIEKLTTFKKNFRARCDRHVNALDLLAEEIETHKNQISILPPHIMADHVIGSIEKKIVSDANPKNEIIDYAQEYANLGRHDFQSLIEKNISKLSLSLCLHYLQRISSILTYQKSGTAIEQFLKLFHNSFKEFRNHAWGGEYEIIFILEIFRQDYADAMIKEFSEGLNDPQSAKELVIDIYLYRIGNLLEQHSIIRKQLEARYGKYDEVAGSAYHITTYFQNTYWEALKLVADRMYRLFKQKTNIDIPYILYADKKAIKDFILLLENQQDLESISADVSIEEAKNSNSEDQETAGDITINPDIVDEIFECLKTFFPNDQNELKKALSGKILERPLVFPESINRLVEVFKRLKYNDQLHSKSTEIKDWICANFQHRYKIGNVAQNQELNGNTVYYILTKHKYEPAKKNRICTGGSLPYKTLNHRKEEGRK